MRKSQFIFVLMLGTSFATMARADDTSLANCLKAAGDGNCKPIGDSDTYYALSGDEGNLTMTIYGTTESGSTAATVPDNASFDDNFPAGITSLKTSGNVDIGDWAFEVATGLTSANLTGVKTIGYGAFSSTGLTSVDLTGVQTIEDCAFYGATGLTSIVISDSLLDSNGNILEFGERDGVYTGIDPYAFNGSGLNTIYCPAGNACGNGFDYLSPTPKIISYSIDENGTYIVDENMYANADMMTKNITCEGAQCTALRMALNAGNTCEAQDACNTLALQYGTPSEPSTPSAPQRADIRIYTIDEANQVAGKVNSVKIRYR